MSCRDELLKFLVGIDKNKVDKDLPEGKFLKFNDSKITASKVLSLFDSNNGRLNDTALQAIKDLMKPMGHKVSYIADIDLTSIPEYLSKVNDKRKVVPYNIALKELLDTQKAEHDKFIKTNNVKKLTKISDDGVMNVGLARSAAVIGRKYAYTMGFRIKSNPKEKAYLSPLAVEKLYHNLGMSVLKDMKKEGLVTLTKGHVINDYYENVKLSQKDATIEMDVALPNIEALVGKEDFSTNKEAYLKHLRGENTSTANSKLNSVTSLISAINTMKISPLESKPTLEPTTREQQAKNDDLVITPTGEEFRNYLTTNPVVINKDAIPYFKDLAKRWSKSTTSMETFVRNELDLGNNSESMLNMFGLNTVDEFTEEISDSLQGQNRSKLSPLEDFLNNINEFVEGEESKDLYMNYNLVRNARLNMDNSILNAQAIKYFRYAVRSKEYTLSADDKEVLTHYIDSIMDQVDEVNVDLGKDIKPGSQEMFDIISGKTPNKALEDQLAIYRGLLNPSVKNKVLKADLLETKGNLMASLDTLGAIEDLRTLLRDGKVVSNYNTKSDATASGGSISTSASLGYSEDAVSVLTRLGFLKNGKATLDDIYALLTNRLNKVLSADDTEEDLANKESRGRDSKTKKEELQRFLDVVYEGNMRDLSKDPTMTFIYNQGKTGAIQTIAQNVTNRLLKRIDDPEVAQYIKDTLKLEETPTLESIVGRKKDLIEALSSNKGIITFIHSQLTAEVNPLIKSRKQIILDLHKALTTKLSKGPNTQDNVKILTPLAIMDGIEDTPQNRNIYGMPLMKRENILNTLKDGGQAVTIEERANSTTAVVNTTHAQDMAIAAKALQGAVREFKTKYPDEDVPGVVFVHDEFITDPRLGILIDDHYMKSFKDVISEYSVEEQLLNQLKEVDPKNPLIAKYEDTINKANETKKELLKNLTSDTGKIYGVKKGTYKIDANFKPTNPGGGKPKVEGKPGSVTVVFNGSGKAYDYTTKDTSKYKVNDTITIPNGTLTIKSVNTTFIPKEGITYKNIDDIVNKAETITKEPWKEDPNNPIPFAVDKQISETMQKLKNKAKNIENDTVFKNLNFTEEEKDKLIKRFGKNKLARMFMAIEHSKNSIVNEKQATPTEYANSGPRFEPDYQEVVMDPIVKDIRQAKVFSKYGTALEGIVAALPKLDSFDKKVATLEILSHEVDHKDSYAYIEEYYNASDTAKKTSKYNAIHYIHNEKLKAKEKLLKLLPTISAKDGSYKGIPGIPEDVLNRFIYILTSSDNVRGMLEFSAVLRNEPKYSKAFYKFLYPENTSKEVSSKLNTVLKYVKQLIAKLTKNYFTGKAVKTKQLQTIFTGIKDIKSKEVLEAALDIAYVNGLGKISYTPTKNIHATKAIKAFEEPLPNGFDPNKNYTKRESTTPEVILGRTTQMLNDVTKNMLIDNIERLGESFTGSMDTLLNTNVPIYADVRSRILHLYNHSSLSSSLQELVHYAKLGKFKADELKQKIIATSHTIKTERDAREHKYIKKINQLTKGFNDATKQELFDLVTKVPIHNYFRFDDQLKTKEDIATEITKLETFLDKSNNDIVNDTVTTITTGKVKSKSIYNLEDYSNGKVRDAMEKLIALKALSVGNSADLILELKKNHGKLYNTMKDNSLALYTLSMKLHGMSPKGATATHTLVKEPYGQRVTFKAISLHDRKFYDSGEHLGWKIIKEPTETTPGVVSKRIMDDTFSEGASLLDDLPEHDVTVPKHLAETYNLVDSNIMEVGGKYKLILTPEEKARAGALNDMATTLVKSSANVIAVDDARYIRNEISKDGVRTVISSEDGDEVKGIVEKIKSDVIDHPWVLKLEDGVRFDKLPEEIRAKYKPIQQNLTSMDGFKDNVTHVRKDIRHWLIGGHVPSLFKNPKVQRYSTILKELISGAKIGMAIVNPKKLLNDSISNTTHLTLLGVPLTKIAKYQRDILKAVDSFNTIKNAMYEAKVMYLGNPTEENEKLYKDLQDKLKHNELYIAYSNGFMTSLSSDVLNSNVQASEGLQADIHKTLKYLLTNKDGSKNVLHTIISNASNFGMDGTHILNRIGDIANTLNTDGEVKKYLDGVAKNIREIKKDDDMAKYLAQFTISPEAETVKAGTWLNDVMDMSMRETYRRHLIDKGVSPQKAIQEAINMSPFYPEDAPIGVKMLSDYFILPFATWTLRVHSPVAHIFKTRSVTLGTEAMIAELLGHDLEIYAASHPFYKLWEDTLASTPLDAVGIGSLAPTNAIGY